MSGPMMGMDVQGVRSLAQLMNQRADEIQQFAAQLTQSLDGAQWVGPDREQFVADWKSHHMASIHAVVEALKHAAQMASQNAQQQEDASRG